MKSTIISVAMVNLIKFTKRGGCFQNENTYHFILIFFFISPFLFVIYRNVFRCCFPSTSEFPVLSYIYYFSPKSWLITYIWNIIFTSTLHNTLQSFCSHDMFVGVTTIVARVLSVPHHLYSIIFISSSYSLLQVSSFSSW